jgi:hypothetical protein
VQDWETQALSALQGRPPVERDDRPARPPPSATTLAPPAATTTSSRSSQLRPGASQPPGGATASEVVAGVLGPGYAAAHLMSSLAGRRRERELALAEKRGRYEQVSWLC